MYIFESEILFYYFNHLPENVIMFANILYSIRIYIDIFYFSACGGVYREELGYIESPRATYNQLMSCDFIILQSEFRKINITFVYFALEDSANCTRNNLQVSYQI